MRRARAESKTLSDGLEQTAKPTGQARRRPRASRVAGGLAVAILLVMLVVYISSMYAGGMGHSMSGDTTVPQDAVVTTVPAPVTGDQMVMSDGSVMDMSDHPSESVGTAVTEAVHVETPVAGTDHSMDMDAAVNWYIIGGILALIAALVAVVAGVKEHLARDIARGTLGMEGVSGE